MKMIEENKIYCEPCLDTLRNMENESVDCVITSPPYWQLRDYGYPEQWGLEPTFAEYLEHLWEMMDEIYRVLKPSGTVWVNLGDTYSGSGGSGGDYNEGGLIDGQPKVRPAKVEVKNKCLLLIPHRFAIGCIDRGWIVRNDIIWAKRNGMPESVTDRFSKKHEYFFFMVKSEKYFFDLDSIRDKPQTGYDRIDAPNERKLLSGVKNNLNPIANNKLGKNPGSVSDFWDIPTKPNNAEHYASYNDSLISKPILAGCPEGGIIYDPFMGTGSTAEAAIRANRRYIGSEASPEYCKMANKRLEPFLMQQTLF
jgi:DNA modification methylase